MNETHNVRRCVGVQGEHPPINDCTFLVNCIQCIVLRCAYGLASEKDKQGVFVLVFIAAVQQAVGQGSGLLSWRGARRLRWWGNVKGFIVGGSVTGVGWCVGGRRRQSFVSAIGVHYIHHITTVYLWPWSSGVCLDFGVSPLLVLRSRSHRQTIITLVKTLYV